MQSRSSDMSDKFRCSLQHPQLQTILRLAASTPVRKVIGISLNEPKTDWDELVSEVLFDAAEPSTSLQHDFELEKQRWADDIHESVYRLSS